MSFISPVASGIPYTIPGSPSGSMPTSIAKALNSEVRMSGFGAAMNGSVDDSTAFTNALAYVNGTGKTLVFDGPACKLNALFLTLVKYTNFVVDFRECAVSIVSDFVGGTVLTLKACNDITFRGGVFTKGSVTALALLSIKGSDAAFATHSPTVPADSEWSRNLRFENMEFTNNLGYFDFEGFTKWCTVTNCRQTIGGVTLFGRNENINVDNATLLAVAPNAATITLTTDPADSAYRFPVAYTLPTSVLSYGAKGDGANDDSSAFAAALTTTTQGPTLITVPPGDYRFAAAAAIPNSCFAQVRGVGNLSVPSTKIFVDYNGAAFTSAVGNTSFYEFENIYCHGNLAYASTQFINDQGTLVHGVLKRLVVYNLKGKAIQLASAFRCELDVLIEYCYDYGITISSGSANRVKFTLDHSYAGGADLFGGGFVIEPYTESGCMNNDPAGANASWREYKLGGAQHTVIGGTQNVYPQNNKYPIELSAARSITFIGVRGLSLGAAPYWINLDANDSSASVVDCPDFTYGGTTTNLIVQDSGYTTTAPDIQVSGQSFRNTTARVWSCFNGVTGANKQSNGVASIVRNGVGDYTINFGSNFANANYAVAITALNAGVTYSTNILSKAVGSVRIGLNNSASTAAADSTDVTVIVTGV